MFGRPANLTSPGSAGRVTHSVPLLLLSSDGEKHGSPKASSAPVAAILVRAISGPQRPNQAAWEASAATRVRILCSVTEYSHSP